MGFDVHLESERGEVLASVADPRNHLHRVLERVQGFDQLFAEIDWNGDTTFNRLQMPRFLSAWQILAEHCTSAEESTVVNEIISLAKRCQNGVHLYLKFIGD